MSRVDRSDDDTSAGKRGEGREKGDDEGGLHLVFVIGLELWDRWAIKIEEGYVVDWKVGIRYRGVV